MFQVSAHQILYLNMSLNTLHSYCIYFCNMYVMISFTGNALENALRQVGREDVIKKTMYNVEVVEDELEAAAARAAMDQSGLILQLCQLIVSHVA